MSITITLEFHPLADLFPLMEGVEFDALVADIKKNGLHYPIILFEGKILDGRNRYRACLEAGFEPATRNGDNSIGDPAAFVISRNIHRRHLTVAQKRDLIAKLLKATPEKSDRQIAETVKASPTTVGTVRAAMEAKGDVSNLDTRTDTKGREQPARKKTANPKPISSEVRRELEASQAHINELETARERDKDLAEQLRAAEIKISGLESEVEDLKAERDRLHERVAELEAALAGSGAVQGEKPKRPRGRPKGSKNKPKAEPATQAEARP
jgi:ParB-like chromosome segregation protein Spo0J